MISRDVRFEQRRNIAVFHDRISGIGGGERVAVMLARILDADLVVGGREDKEAFGGLDDLNVIDLELWNSEPKRPYGYALRMFRCMAGFFFLNHDYETIVCSGQWAHYGRKHSSRKIWYCHSPPRFLYDLYEPIKRGLNVFGKAAFSMLNAVIKPLDRLATDSVDEIIVNSQNVAVRASRYYGRDSTVVHPPSFIERTEQEAAGLPFDDFFLSVQRFTAEKRIDLQLEAFRDLDENLVVVGGTVREDETYKEICEVAESMSNVVVLPNVSDEKLSWLYSNAKATVQTPLFEDFGMVPVESMSHSTPVIAVDEEGMTETVQDGRTGVLISTPYKDTLRSAVKDFCVDDYHEQDLLARAKQFSEEGFANKILSYVHGNNSVMINLGCGHHYRPGWVNVDVDTRVKADHYVDVEENGWSDELPAADVIVASHLAEHLQDIDSFIAECHDLLKKGGRLVLRVPCSFSENQFTDPTHERAFTPRTFGFFTGDAETTYETTKEYSFELEDVKERPRQGLSFLDSLFARYTNTPGIRLLFVDELEAVLRKC